MSNTESPYTRYSGIITLFQLIGTGVWIFGTLGSILAYAVPIFRSITVYGRLLNTTTTISNGTGNPTSPLSSLYRLFTLIQSYLLRWTVPKRWFTGFYVVGFLMNTYTIVNAYYGSYPRWSLFLLCLYGIHLLRRIYECLFLHQWSTSARMPIVLYLFGMTHYLFVPWTLLPSCLLHNTNNIFTYLAIPLFKLVSLNIDDITTFPHVTMNSYQPTASWLANVPYIIVIIRGGITFIVGCGLFLLGNRVQYSVHQQLAALRTARISISDDNNNKQNGYSPRNNDENPYARSYQRYDNETLPDQPTATTVSRRRTTTSVTTVMNTGIAPNVFQDIDISSSPTTPTELSNIEAFSSSSSIATAVQHPQFQHQQYPLPSGGYFDYAVCPHYTAEIIIYLGLFMLNNAFTLLYGYESVPTCSTSLSSLLLILPSFVVPFLSSIESGIFIITSIGNIALLLWVITNLCVTGARTRRWYVENYPREQRVRYTAAVIPYIW